MVKYFRDFQTELQEAVANLVADQRSDEVVQGFDPERTTRLLMNVMRNPQTPAGLQLALVDEPPEVQDQVALAWSAASSAQAILNQSPSFRERMAMGLGSQFGPAERALRSGLGAS